MGEVVERVARAIAPAAWGWRGKVGDSIAQRNRRMASLKHARAAIEAMREPDEAMCDAAANPRPRMHVGHTKSDEIAGRIATYVDMIDAALAAPAPDARGR